MVILTVLRYGVTYFLYMYLRTNLQGDLDIIPQLPLALDGELNNPIILQMYLNITHINTHAHTHPNTDTHIITT